MDWLKDELEKLSEKQDRMNETLIRNTATLEEHVRRTNLLEAEIKPIKRHVDVVQGAGKFTVAIAGLVATLKSIGLL